MATAKERLETAYGNSFIDGLPNSENCSGFLKSLGESDDMKFYVPDGQADNIIKELNSLTKNNNLVSAWEKLGIGNEGMKKAILEARQGRLVIAAMTAADYGQSHGHVAIVLSKLEGPHNAPLIYGGGSPDARSQGDKTIRQVWSPAKHNFLQFFMHRTVFLGAYK